MSRQLWCAPRRLPPLPLSSATEMGRDEALYGGREGPWVETKPSSSCPVTPTNMIPMFYPDRHRWRTSACGGNKPRFQLCPHDIKKTLNRVFAQSRQMAYVGKMAPTGKMILFCSYFASFDHVIGQGVRRATFRSRRSRSLFCPPLSLTSPGRSTFGPLARRDFAPPPNRPDDGTGNGTTRSLRK